MSPSSSSPRTGEGTFRVLHVDDQPDFSELASIYLERADDRFEVVPATSASMGLDRLSEQAFDCVISDYDMPGCNGIEFLEEVREDYPELPFVLFTGKGTEEIASDAISAGVTDYLQKQASTCQYTVLANTVSNAIEHYRAQEYADETEHRLRTIAENTNDILWQFSADWDELLFINPPYEEIWGRSIEELRERPQSFLDGIHPDDRDLVTEAMGQISSGESFDIEYRVNADEDFGRWVWVQGEPVFDADGEVEKVVGFARDITARKHREEETADREQALRSTYEIITDDDRSVDEQIDDLLELGWDHLGTDYATFSHIQDDRYEFERVKVGSDIDLETGATTDLIELPMCERVFQTGEPVVISDVAADAPELADPEWGIASYLGAPVFVNGAPYGTFCFYDVESRSDAFSDWEQTFVQLVSDWVGSEITQLQTTEQLQRQNEQLGEFANVVSHDLRNPLNVAEGRLELAQGECDSEHLNAIEKAHSRMEALIEDILILARNGHEVTEYTPVDLGTLIDDCWATVETADSDLVTDIDRTVLADRSRLLQLFENLVRNAVEHSGDDVTVTVGELESGFYIEDDGVGIPEAERDEVFEFGFSTNPDGTGFGLRIAKQVAEAHNWEMQLSERESGGARFEITGCEFDGT